MVRAPYADRIHIKKSKMIRSVRKGQSKKGGTIYFNFSKFERLLDGLKKRGEDVTSAEYLVKNLRSFKDFSYYFQNFTDQEINAQLLFYRMQFHESLDDSTNL